MIGVVLAGGAARRMGGAKAGAVLGGRPLLVWALEALREAGLEEVVVVAKRATTLPPVDAPVWHEPDEPRHPLAGVRYALQRARPDEVLTLPVDLPLAPPAALRALVAWPPQDACCVVARAGGRLEPLVGRFASAALGRLRAEGRATDAILALDPVLVDLPGEGFHNVNSPSDLAAAQAALA